MMKLLFFVLLLLFPLSAWAEMESDSLGGKKNEDIEKIEEFELSNKKNFESFSPRPLILPAAFISLGAFAVENNFLCNQKSRLQDEIQRHAAGHHFSADDYLRFAPLAIDLALPAFGVKGRLPYREKIAVAVSANILMALLTEGGKHAFAELRPDRSDRRSFPSGHSASAFLGAELVRMDYGPTYGAAAYTIATLTAAARLWNNRHWVNDVLAGAGIGILSARAAYWLLPLERRLFHWTGSSSAPLTIVPYYTPAGHNLGATFAITW